MIARALALVAAVALVGCVASHVEPETSDPSPAIVVPLACAPIGDAYDRAVARLGCEHAAPTLVGCWYLDRPCDEIGFHGALGWPDPPVIDDFDRAPSCVYLATTVHGFCPEIAP